MKIGLSPQRNAQLGFGEWMRLVDIELVKKCGMESDDLPDYCYRDSFDDGRSPEAVVKSALRAAKECGGLDDDA